MGTFVIATAITKAADNLQIGGLLSVPKFRIIPWVSIF